MQEDSLHETLKYEETEGETCVIQIVRLSCFQLPKFHEMKMCLDECGKASETVSWGGNRTNVLR